MENTAETIADIKNLLSRCRSEAQIISSDPVVRQWSTLDIGKHAAILAEIGINHHEVQAAAGGYRKTVDDTLQHVTRHENELSNLEADLRLNSLDANEAHKLTLKLRNAAIQGNTG